MMLGVNIPANEALASGPMQVVVNPTRFDDDSVQEAGQELRFEDEQATVLSHEIDWLDPTGLRNAAPEGGEQVMEAALSIGLQIPVTAIASAFHPYLTLDESMKLGAQMFYKNVSQLSGCAL